MKFNKGFAAEIKNAAWMIPRMPPIINAEDADGMCLFSCLILATSKLLASNSDLDGVLSDSDA